MGQTTSTSTKSDAKETKEETNAETITDPDFKKALETDGIVVIPGVLSPEECDRMFNGMWDCFEHLSSEWDIPILRTDQSTWKEFRHFKPNNSMMYQGWGISHAQHLWDIRSNPHVVNIWADLLQTKPEDLFVSYDGISWLVPHEPIDLQVPEFTPWFHLDQTVLKTEADGYQGLITGLDVRPGDATFVYYPDSHKLVGELTDRFGVRTESDWYPLTPEENDFYRSKCGEPIQLTCSAGSLVIWDSRLVHCNKVPDQIRSEPNYRCVQYLSYAPKPLDLQTIKEKVKGFYAMRTSNHYAGRASFFPDIPYVYKSQGYRLEELVTPLSHPLLNNLGQSLAGLTSLTNQNI